MRVRIDSRASLEAADINEELPSKSVKSISWPEGVDVDHSE